MLGTCRLPHETGVGGTNQPKNGRGTRAGFRESCSAPSNLAVMTEPLQFQEPWDHHQTGPRRRWILVELYSASSRGKKHSKCNDIRLVAPSQGRREVMHTRRHTGRHRCPLH